MASRYIDEWIKVDDLIRDRVFSLEHLIAVRILLENLPSKKWDHKRDLEEQILTVRKEK